MKKSILFSLVLVCLTFIFTESGLCQDTLLDACFHRYRGTVRIVSDTAQCNLRFETPLTWHQAIPPGGFAIDLYVNTSGQDLPGRGLTPINPFRTVTYALQQIIHLRPTQEIQAVINVAPGTYSENLSIGADNISIRKADGIAGNVVIDGGGSNVVTINGARGVAITDVTIQNAFHGIFGRNGATFEVSGSIVQDSAGRGIQILGNSKALLTNCDVMRSGGDGIWVSRNSTATLSGNLSSNDNGNDGLLLSHSSSVYSSAATITTNNNDRRGITAVNNCAIISVYSSTTAQNNSLDGIGVIGSSSIEFWEKETLTLEKNGRRGLFVFGTSFVWAFSGTTIDIKDNGAQGLYMAQNVSMDFNGTLTIEDNVYTGMFLNNSAHVDIENPAVVAVRGTSGRGIWVGNGSILNAPSGSLTVEGNDGDGIAVARGSSIVLRSATIQNNDRHGVVFFRNSNGDFWGSTEILGNDEKGVFADDGSTVYSSGSTITGNTPDVVLEFGSRATLNGNTIGTLPITCDATSFSRGDLSHLCP